MLLVVRPAADTLVFPMLGIVVPMLGTQTVKFLLIPRLPIRPPLFPVFGKPPAVCQTKGCWILLVPRTPLRSQLDTTLSVILALVLHAPFPLFRLFFLAAATGDDSHRICRDYCSKSDSIASKRSLFETRNLLPMQHKTHA
jgi:hypothetical protein